MHKRIVNRGRSHWQNNFSSFSSCWNHARCGITSNRMDDKIISFLFAHWKIIKERKKLQRREKRFFRCQQNVFIFTFFLFINDVWSMNENNLIGCFMDEKSWKKYSFWEIFFSFIARFEPFQRNNSCVQERLLTHNNDQRPFTGLCFRCNDKRTNATRATRANRCCKMRCTCKHNNEVMEKQQRKMDKMKSYANFSVHSSTESWKRNIKNNMRMKMSQERTKMINAKMQIESKPSECSSPKSGKRIKFSEILISIFDTTSRENAKEIFLISHFMLDWRKRVESRDKNHLENVCEMNVSAIGKYKKRRK